MVPPLVLVLTTRRERPSPCDTSPPTINVDELLLHVLSPQCQASEQRQRNDVRAEDDGGLRSTHDVRHSRSAARLIQGGRPQRRNERSGVRARQSLLERIEETDHVGEATDQVFHGESPDQPQADRERRAPKDDTEERTDDAPCTEDQPASADAPRHIQRGRPVGGPVLRRGYHPAPERVHREGTDDEYQNHRHDGQHLAAENRRTFRSLRQDRLEGLPAVLAADRKRADHEGDCPREQREAAQRVGNEPRRQHVGEQLGGRLTSREPAHSAASISDVGDEVPEHLCQDEQHGGEDPHRRPLHEFQDLRPVAADHRSFSSPVSSRNTSSSVRSSGRSSLTATPASTSSRLICERRAGSESSRSVPSTTSTRSDPRSRSTRSRAADSGSARTSTDPRPRISSTAPSAISDPWEITPTRSTTCSTSLSR